MTRKEAIKVLKNGGIEVCGEVDRISEFIAALDVALDALIPPTRENELEAENRELKERIVNWRKCMAPTRERVEKVWRGCEYCSGDVDNRPYLDSKRLYLDKNGVLTDEIENIDILRLEFCPKCGKPLTDEAVDMMMERLEAPNEKD